MKYYFTVLRKYAVFKGRSRRKEFWYFMLFNFIFMFLLQIIGMELKLPEIDAHHKNILLGLYQLSIALPFLGAWIRRMHDINKSGWYSLIPLYNLILACKEGTRAINEYGGDPKYKSNISN